MGKVALKEKLKTTKITKLNLLKMIKQNLTYKPPTQPNSPPCQHPERAQQAELWSGAGMGFQNMYIYIYVLS